MVQTISSGLILSILLFFTGCANHHSEENIYSVLVSKNGELVHEEYYNGKSDTVLFNVQSVTKSITSLLIGIAIDQGHIKSEESYLHEYLATEYLSDGQKKKIKLKHLLSHTSGLQWGGYLEHEQLLGSANVAEFVLDRAMLASPGELYNYNSGATHLLSQVLTNATGMTTLEFAHKNLFLPLECGSIQWKKLGDGYYDGSGLGLSMTAQGLMKIGNLVLNNGVFEGQQLVTNNWISKSFDETEKKSTNWGIRKSTHGYGWYSHIKNGKQILYAMGYGGQFIFVIPADKIVMVVTHNDDTPKGIEQQVDYLSGSFDNYLSQFIN